MLTKKQIQLKKDAAVKAGKVDFSVFRKSDEEKALLKKLKKGAIKSSSNKMVFQF